MAFCKYCGTELGAEHKFCGGCGAPIKSSEETEKTETVVEENIENNADTETAEQGTYENTYSAEPISEEVFEEPAKSGKLSVGMLVWSIINTVISSCVCCLPIGILPFVFSVLTKNADYDASLKNRKRALICNIISSAIILIWVVAFIVLMVLGIYYGDSVDHGASYKLYDVSYYR